MMSVVAVTPVCVTWATGGWRSWAPGKTAEFGVLLLLAGAAAVLAHFAPLGSANYLPAYLGLPFLLWAAFRLGTHETALTAVVLGAVALWSTYHGWGWLARSGSEHGLLACQGFIAFNCVTGLAVAALVRERERAREALGRARGELEERVRQRTRSLEAEIEHRRRTEAALRESEARLARTQAVSLVMLAQVDLDGRWLKVPPILCELLGYSEAELLQLRSQDLTEPADRQMDLIQQSRVLHGHIASYDLEKRMRRKDGRIIWVYLNRSLVRDERGDPVCFLTYFRDITQRREMELELQSAREDLEKRVEARTAELSHANRALQAEVAQRRRAEAAHSQVLQRLVDAQETERRRLSHELHDEMGQELTALKLGLQLAQRESPVPATLARRLEQLQRMADGLMQDVHHLTWELRPPALDDFGLALALRRYVEEWSKHSGVVVDFESDGAETRRLPSPQEVTLYRVTQEALNNTAKHAKASRVSVVLKRVAGGTSLIVEDDGLGFDPERLPATPGRHGRMGLLGIRERVALAGGTVEVESSLGRGTTVYVRLPITEETSLMLR
jgi:PAS domain S-box-containing protein